MSIPKDRLEQLSERWFRSNREELAAELASGETLVAYGKPLLDAEDLDNRIYTENLTEINSAIRLCATNPELGGRHVKRICEAVALELVDAYEDTLRDSYEQEINRSDAA